MRAALESIPYQIKDVISAMEADTGITLQELKIDGGLTSNTFVVQFLADLLEKPVVSLGLQEVSALGAAYLMFVPSDVVGHFQLLSQRFSRAPARARGTGSDLLDAKDDETLTGTYHPSASPVAGQLGIAFVEVGDLTT